MSRDSEGNMVELVYFKPKDSFLSADLSHDQPLTGHSPVGQIKEGIASFFRHSLTGSLPKRGHFGIKSDRPTRAKSGSLSEESTSDNFLRVHPLEHYRKKSDDGIYGYTRIARSPVVTKKDPIRRRKMDSSPTQGDKMEFISSLSPKKTSEEVGVFDSEAEQIVKRQCKGRSCSLNEESKRSKFRTGSLDEVNLIGITRRRHSKGKAPEPPSSSDLDRRRSTSSELDRRISSGSLSDLDRRLSATSVNEEEDYEDDDDDEEEDERRKHFYYTIDDMESNAAADGISLDKNNKDVDKVRFHMFICFISRA